MRIESTTWTSPLKEVKDLPLFDPKAWNYGKRRLSREPLTFHIEPYRRLGSIYRFRYLQREHIVMAGLEANEFVSRNTDLWNYVERMKMFRDGFDETCIFQLDGEEHQKKRRRLAQGFRPTCLAPLVSEMNQVLVEEIAALPDGRANLRTFSKRLTSSMTSQALLHVRLPRGMDKQIDLFSRNLLSGEKWGPLQPLWYKRPSYQRLRRELFADIHRMLDERDAHPSAKDDILSFGLQHPSLDDAPFTRHETALDVLFLLQGGTETASSIIIWALMYLYYNPEWLAAAREELKAWDPLTFKNLNDWPRLKAIIQEIERLYPPVPFFILIPVRDFEYQGYRIPRGRRIFYPSTLTHVLPEIYENPLSFQPERFLGKHEYPAKAHTTFGSSAHACFGQPLARLKILMVLAHVLTQYDLVFEEKPSFQQLLGIVLTPKERVLPVRFVPRS